MAQSEFQGRIMADALDVHKMVPAWNVSGCRCERTRPRALDLAGGGSAAAVAARTMITETSQPITCFISMKSEIPCDTGVLPTIHYDWPGCPSPAGRAPFGL
jgi:hypothetical protein